MKNSREKTYTTMNKKLTGHLLSHQIQQNELDDRLAPLAAEHPQRAGQVFLDGAAAPSRRATGRGRCGVHWQAADRGQQDLFYLSRGGRVYGGFLPKQKQKKYI